MRPTLCVIVFALLLPTFAHAATVDALVDRDRITPAESLNLQVSIQNGQGSVEVDAITDFKVLSRGTSTSVKIVNGQTSREVTYSYTLIPLKEGRLQIPPLNVRLDDQTLQTRPIFIQVAPDKDAQPDNREVFVEAQLSRPDPFVGQQLTYTFRLFNAVQITNAQFQPPAFDGFTAQELEKRNTYRKVINGREYAVAEVIYILVPIAAGSKKIEAATLQCDVVRTRRSSNRSRSFFDDRFFGHTELEPRVLRTDPLSVTVRPLPDYNGAVPFSGLVGSMNLTADLEPKTLKVGDSATLTLTFQGSGNIMDAAAPAIDLSTAFKVYTDNPEEKITVDRSGYAGRKIFRAAIVPIIAGEYTLPTFNLCYFDVQQEKYVVRSTAPLPLHVEPAVSDEHPEVFQTPPAEFKSLKKRVEFTGRDILPIKQELTALEDRRSMSFALFCLLIVGPALGFGLVAVLLRMTRKEQTPALRMAARARKALKKARAQNLPTEAFLTCLYRALTSAILSRSGSLGEALTWKEAQDILLASGYEPDKALHAARLLQEIESSKYSGVSLAPQEQLHLLNAARETIRGLLK